MKVYIIGIDGLELDILNHYESFLPNFGKIRNKGCLGTINSVYPVDSVPAWQTIFTGLNPAQHGIVRGKDYVESLQDFEKINNYNLKGNTFWDKISAQNKKCLILNPFLAYPAWRINGLMISGPAFVEGDISKYPESTHCNPAVYGGYKPTRRDKLKDDLLEALEDIKGLWKEFETHTQDQEYDLCFITFTQLDRIQHYAWRFYDKGDPLHEEDVLLSDLIKKAYMLLDSFIGKILSKMNDNDHLVIISDHGFGRRPYKLVNFNEIFRQHGLLKLSENKQIVNVRFIQKVRNFTIRTLSNLKVLDIVSKVARKLPALRKYKKSDFLIDTDNSLCYTDQFFSGKNAYCGFNFGQIIKNGSEEKRNEVINKIKEIFSAHPELPRYKWMKTSNELYKGKYAHRYPDICTELETGYGVEFDMFGEILTKSVTHYVISGGHRNPSTFGYYTKNNFQQPCITAIDEFHNFVLSLFK